MARSLTVTGVKELDEMLSHLSRREANTIAWAGLRAGLADISKAIKSEVPRRIRPAISHRLKRDKRRGVRVGKVGGGVGKRRGSSVRRSRSRGRGVGISKENVHWYLMGTVTRYRRSGGTTGAMPQHGAVRRGYAKARASSFTAMKKKMAERIRKLEARKRG